MLRIESRSVTGDCKIYEPAEGTEDQSPHPYTPGVHFGHVYIQTTLASMFGKPVFEIIKVEQSKDAHKFSDDYCGPNRYENKTLATGFDSPEDALVWMEDNRDKWDTNA